MVIPVGQWLYKPSEKKENESKTSKTDMNDHFLQRTDTNIWKSLWSFSTIAPDTKN